MSEERDDGEHGDGEGAGSQATLCACVSEERGDAQTHAHAFLGNVVQARSFIHDIHFHTRYTYTILILCMKSEFLPTFYLLFFRVHHITASSTTDKWQQH